MSIEPIKDFTHFFEIEENNLLGSIANLGEDYFLIHNLDILYQSCMRLQPMDERSLKIPLFLYLTVHGEFYNALSSYLRIHKSISFRCMRSALDCAFTSYYLLKYPEKLDVYLSKLTEDNNNEIKKEWDDIFQNIKRTIKNKIKDKFPLAKGLPEIHEFCSIYSHSDALGLLHKYQEDKERGMLTAKYFDYEKTHTDFNKWLSCVLVTFFKIWLLYWQEVFINRAGNKLHDIEKTIAEFQKRLKSYTERYPFDVPINESGNKMG